MNTQPEKLVSLGLQGGGAHGAFTWGVLDRLLEDERLEIEGISGSSSGAMNAVMLAHGLTIGGREGARQALAHFWETVANRMPFNPRQGSLFLGLTRILSPYQLNPFDLNPCVIL